MESFPEGGKGRGAKRRVEGCWLQCYVVYGRSIAIGSSLKRDSWHVVVAALPPVIVLCSIRSSLRSSTRCSPSFLVMILLTIYLMVLPIFVEWE